MFGFFYSELVSDSFLEAISSYALQDLGIKTIFLRRKKSFRWSLFYTKKNKFLHQNAFHFYLG